MEYEVYLLDDTKQLCHKGEALIATNNLATACSYCSDYYIKYQKPICVYQPRHGYYREHYAPWLKEEDDEDMSLPKEIKMTRDGGNYWRAMTFRHVVTWLIMLPVIVSLVVAIINPFWFRDSFFRWVETKVNQVAQWRNYRTYAMYLGADPKMWHALKDAA